MESKITTPKITFHGKVIITPQTQDGIVIESFAFDNVKTNEQAGILALEWAMEQLKTAIKGVKKHHPLT